MNQPGATPTPSRIIRFGLFEVDLQAGELRKDGLKIKLQEQPFRVLSLLLERAGQVVTREELRQKLWSTDTFVDFEHSLNTSIKKLRQALGDSADNPRFVETQARRGYRFIAQVEEVSRVVRPEMASPEIATSPRPESSAKLQEAEPHKESPRLKSRAALIGSAAVLILIAGGVGWFYLRRPSSSLLGVASMKVVRFTSYPGKERDPALSPDGKQLAFVWDGEQRDNFDVYVQAIGGEKPLRLTNDPSPDVSPVWSPDGSQIAFARLSEGISDIYLMPSSGGHERKLTELYSVWSEGKALDWSPDGKFLAAAGKSSREDPYGLFMIEVETGKKHVLTSAPIQFFADFHPTFSPDGQTVAFGRVGGNSVYLVPVVGGQPKPLTFDCDSCGAAWTADGQELLYFSYSGGSHKLRRVSAHGGKPQSVDIITQGAFPSISHRGSRLAYVEQLYDTDIWRIEVPNSRGRASPPTKLIHSSQDDDNPQYSPDGKKIVFGSSRSGTYESWVCDRDGRNPFPLISSSEITRSGSARWSPDGRTIAFNATWAKGARIFTISPEGGSPHRLTEEDADGYVPSWSKDGRWIYFSSNRTGEPQIWKIPAEGGQAVQVTKNGGLEPVEAPDGEALYYSKINKNEARSGSAQIWKTSLQSGRETLAFDEAVYTRYWTVAERGIYFVPADWSQQPAIKFFSFSTGLVTQVVALEKAPVAYGDPGLTISPDGRWILCALVEQDESDIMLVENFR